MRKNKYEDIQMIDLENKVEDIVEIYIDRLYHTDKTVGIVVNKDIAEYILDNLVKLDETSIKEVDLVDYMNINEYLVSVDDDGCISVIPIEDFIVLDNTDIVYIDMDGDIEQNIIDYCVNEDKEVVLFGQDDECICGDECGKTCHCGLYDNVNPDRTVTTTTATYKINGKEVTKEEYNKAAENVSDFLSFVSKVWDII